MDIVLSVIQLQTDWILCVGLCFNEVAVPSKTRTFFARLKSFLLFCCVGIIAGGLVAQILAMLIYPAPVEWTWNKLESPFKINAIVGVSETKAWFQAESGLSYAAPSKIVCDGMFDAGMCSWKQSSPESEGGYFVSGEKFRALIKSGCEASYRYIPVEVKYPPKSAGAPLECTAALQHAPSIGIGRLVYYVLTDRGEVWMMVYEPMEQLSRTLKLAVMYLICMGLGLAAGIVAWFMR
jgi:hypothetical protein